MSEEFDCGGEEKSYMRLLDHFAGLAMQSFLESYLRDRESMFLWLTRGELNLGAEHQWSTAKYNIAEHAYEIAQDMMSSRVDLEYELQQQIKDTVEGNEEGA